MRVLCTTLPEYGHFHPMAPLALALAAAGHEVAFATAGEFCPRVERAGFRALPAGLGHDDQLRQARALFPREASMPAGHERFLAFVPRMLAGVAAPATLADLVPIVRDWRPDVLVHDEAELAGPIAARVCGLPHVAHGVGILRQWEALRLAGDVLAPLARRWGVELGPLGGLFDYLYLGVCPPSVQAPHIADIPVAYSVRADFDAAGDEALPAWVRELPDAVPTVYVTLGTLFNRDASLFRLILDSLGGEPVTVVATIGYDGDRAALGEQPENVRIHSYIPQSQLLPYCDVVVAQGGWSFVSVLAHGLPMLLLPQGANQFYHSKACVDAGAARWLLPSEISSEAIRGGLRVLLDDPSYRGSAQRVQREISLMPPPEEAVLLVERVAREGRPLERADSKPS